MASPPSSALAGAAVAAAALAPLVAGLADGLGLPAEARLPITRTCRTIALTLAPRITARRDVAEIARRLAGAVQDAARAAEPRDAAPLLYAAAVGTLDCVPVSASPSLTLEFAYARALAAGIEAACLGEAFLAAARSEFGDRIAATRAREEIAARVDAAAERVADALGQEVYGVLSACARECGAHLVAIASTLQPVIRVDATRSFPSTALAWSLYGDPARAAELLARNACGTPLFMPATFEAVGPGA